MRSVVSGSMPDAEEALPRGVGLQVLVSGSQLMKLVSYSHCSAALEAAEAAW